MIDVTQRDSVTVLRMAHGKANALDIEFCEALTSQLDECQRSPSTGALVLTGTGRMFSAGVDLPRVVEGGAVVCARVPAGGEQDVPDAVRLSEARRDRGQRPRDRGRLRDGVRRRCAADGA